MYILNIRDNIYQQMFIMDNNSIGLYLILKVQL